jgi:alkylation response protein AidB-like acyl-CoA dehydrogenase
VLDALFAATPHPFTTLRAWFEATASVRTGSTIERALLGGAHADRLACAFAAGYSEALRALVPDLEGIAALSATEAEGNHPRAIRTRLEPAADGFRLTGTKKWATGAAQAAALLVVASIGDDPTTGRNRLRLVRVPTSAPNLVIRSSAAPFVPEIEHAEIELAGVEVPADAVLPGDGYDDYVKPFRTVEDLHVHAALVGYLLTLARVRTFAPSLVEELADLACPTRDL